MNRCGATHLSLLSFASTVLAHLSCMRACCDLAWRILRKLCKSSSAPFGNCNPFCFLFLLLWIAVMGDAGSESGQACFSIDLRQGLSVSGNVQSLLATYQAANVASQSALVDAEANHRRVLKQLKAEKKRRKRSYGHSKGLPLMTFLRPLLQRTHRAQVAPRDGTEYLVGE